MIIELIVAAPAGVLFASVVVRAVRRRPRPELVTSPTLALIAGPVAVPVPHGATSQGDGYWSWTDGRSLAVDPTGEVLEHVAPGPGSLTSLADVGPGSIVRITSDDLVDPEVAQALDAALAPALEAFQAGMEPAMRTVRLWQLRAYADRGPLASLWADLDFWRIDTPTGEYPSLLLSDPRYAAADLAEALLLS